MASQDWFDKDFYKVLGVDKSVSAADLKKTYRKLARQYHPDSNPGDAKAEAKFKEISEAYSVLNDPEQREEYDQIIREEVEVAIAADDEALDRLCANYLDNVRAYTTREQVQGADGAPRDPDERLMRSVEERTDIPESRKDDFRHELMNFIAAVHLEGGQFDYRENRRLRRALELKLFEDQRDSIQLTTLISQVVDPLAEEKIATIRDRLCERFGYDHASAGAVLLDVAGLFARQEAADQQPDGEGATPAGERAA